MTRRLLDPAKALRTLRKTPVLLEVLLRGVTQAQAQVLRDGADGWSVLFIVCHLRDYEAAARARVEAMLAEDRPTFARFDNEELARRHAYADQELRATLAELAAGRRALIARLEGLPAAAWDRRGLHPEQGEATLLEVAINVGLHDVDHLEQLAHCLAPAHGGDHEA